MPAPDFDADGWTLLRCALPLNLLADLRDRIFHSGEAGTRCLLDDPDVATAARELPTFATAPIQLSALDSGLSASPLPDPLSETPPRPLPRLRLRPAHPRTLAPRGIMPSPLR